MSRDDRKRLYTYGELPDKTALEIHLDYQYTYDDIKLIWNARCDLLLRWVKEQNIPAENIRPIIRPDYEISYQAKRGEAGSLRKYLNDERRDAALEEKDNKSRLIVIPLNTGGHWVTLILYIQGNNTLNSVAYIDSLHKDVSDKPYLGLLPESHYIVKEITEVYLEFNQQVRLFAHYIQSDKKACGVLGIENAMAFIKWSCTKGSTIECQLQPMRCDDDTMTRLRGIHLQLIGGTNHRLYEKQRNNVIDVASAETQFLILDHLEQPTLVEEEGNTVIDLILQLDSGHQQILLEAFSAEYDDQHNAHLTHIRNTLVTVYQALQDVDESSVQKTAYKLLLETLYGLPFETFWEEKDFNKPFQASLDYEQLKVIGFELAKALSPDGVSRKFGSDLSENSFDNQKNPGETDTPVALDTADGEILKLLAHAKIFPKKDQDKEWVDIVFSDVELAKLFTKKLFEKGIEGEPGRPRKIGMTEIKDDDTFTLRLRKNEFNQLPVKAHVLETAEKKPKSPGSASFPARSSERSLQDDPANRVMLEVYRQLVKPLVDYAMETASTWEKESPFLGESPAIVLRAAAERLRDRPLRSLYRWSGELFQLLSEDPGSPRYRKRVESLYLGWLQERGELSLGEAHRSVPRLSEFSKDLDAKIVGQALSYKLVLWDQGRPARYRFEPLSDEIKQGMKACEDGVFYVEFNGNDIRYMTSDMQGQQTLKYTSSLLTFDFIFNSPASTPPSTLDELGESLRTHILKLALKNGHIPPAPAKGNVYFRKKGNVLEYMVMNPSGKTVRAQITPEDWSRVSQEPLDLKEPLGLDELWKYRSKILSITSARGHTLPVVPENTRKTALEVLGRGRPIDFSKKSALQALIASMEASLNAFKQWWEERKQQEEVEPVLKDKFERRIAAFHSVIEVLKKITSQEDWHVLDTAYVGMQAMLKSYQAIQQKEEEYKEELALFKNQKEWASERNELSWEPLLEHAVNGLQALQEKSVPLEDDVLKDHLNLVYGIGAVKSDRVKVKPDRFQRLLKALESGLDFFGEVLHFISGTPVLKGLFAGSGILHTLEDLVKYGKAGHAIAEFFEMLHVVTYFQKKWEEKTKDYSRRTQDDFYSAAFPPGGKGEDRARRLLTQLVHVYGDSLSRLNPESQALFLEYLFGMAMSYVREDFLSLEGKRDDKVFCEELLSWLAFSQYAMNALKVAADLNEISTDLVLTLWDGGTVSAWDMLSRSGRVCHDAQGRRFLYWNEGQSPGLYGVAHASEAEVGAVSQLAKARHRSGSAILWEAYRLEPMSEAIKKDPTQCLDGVLYVDLKKRSQCIEYLALGMKKPGKISAEEWGYSFPGSWAALEAAKDRVLKITSDRGDTRVTLYYGNDLQHHEADKGFKVIPFEYQSLPERMEKVEETQQILKDTVTMQHRWTEKVEKEVKKVDKRLGKRLGVTEVRTEMMSGVLLNAPELDISKEVFQHVAEETAKQRDAARAEVEKLKKTVMDQQVTINGLATRVETLESDKKQLEGRLKKQEAKHKEEIEKIHQSLAKLGQPVAKGAEPEHREDQEPPVRDDIAENPDAKNVLPSPQTNSTSRWSSHSVFAPHNTELQVNRTVNEPRGSQVLDSSI